MTDFIEKPPQPHTEPEYVRVEGTHHIWTKNGEYYFEDETQDFNGPFSSKEEVIKQLNLYCEYVLGPKVI